MLLREGDEAGDGKKQEFGSGRDNPAQNIVT